MEENQELKDSVSVEGFAATLRYHPDGGYGSPYIFVCTLVRVGNVGYIHGGAGEFNARCRRLIRVKMLEMGITEIHFDRIANNSVRSKVLT